MWEFNIHNLGNTEIKGLSNKITLEVEVKIERVKNISDENAKLKEKNQENEIFRKRL